MLCRTGLVTCPCILTESSHLPLKPNVSLAHCFVISFIENESSLDWSSQWFMLLETLTSFADKVSSETTFWTIGKVVRRVFKVFLEMMDSGRLSCRRNVNAWAK